MQRLKLILINSINWLKILTRDDKKFLIACSLGDGCLYKDKRCNSVSFKLTHSIKQKSYFLWKVDRIKTILNCDVNLRYFKRHNKYPAISYEKGHKYFRIIRKWLYKDSKKKISRYILNKLNVEGIAIWYMDDGCLSYKKRNGKIHARELTLNTYLSKEENDIIITYFKDVYNIHFKISKSKNKYRLRMGTIEAKKFVQLIKPYIHESMLYKIDFKY